MNSIFFLSGTAKCYIYIYVCVCVCVCLTLLNLYKGPLRSYYLSSILLKCKKRLSEFE